MARISLWKPHKGNDYKFADRVASENIFIGGAGILVHKYLSSVEGGDESAIQDVLFLENRNRNYSEDVFELRAHFSPVDSDYDLSQFGIFLSSDVVKFEFHYNDMSEMLGRKLMAGDVLEVPSERDVTLSGEVVNSYYVVQDALYSAQGHGVTWHPHIWKVRAKKLSASPEYEDIIQSAASGSSLGGEGGHTGLMPDNWQDLVEGQDNAALRDAANRYCAYLGITDAIVKEAEDNVFYDPTFFEIPHLYIFMTDEGYPLIKKWRHDDGVPDNGAPLRGIGTSFPEDMEDGEYFLRVDYTPDRLFQKQGTRYVKVEDDLRKYWTAQNAVLDSFVNNINITTHDDGSYEREKQDLHNVATDRSGLYDEHKQDTLEAELSRSRVAKKLDGSL